MKKIVIATLLAMSATVAQAQVTVTGKVSEWMRTTKSAARNKVRLFNQICNVNNINF
jgi:predicted porin